jgi:hypothetical protein
MSHRHFIISSIIKKWHLHNHKSYFEVQQVNEDAGDLKWSTQINSKVEEEAIAKILVLIKITSL